MVDASDDKVRQKAYEIWEREGRPEGRHDAHWEQAEREAAAEEGVKKPKKRAKADVSVKEKAKPAAKATKTKPSEKADKPKSAVKRSSAKK